MRKRPLSYLTTIALLAISLAIFGFALNESVTWYERPFAGILVDPEGTVSSFGLPTWDGFRKGLRYPDQILMVDDEALELPRSPWPRFGEHRATTWDLAVDRAAAAQRTSVHVRARTASGVRELDLELSPFEPLGWWLHAGGEFLIGLLYVLAAAVAFLAAPESRLARTFAKTACFAGLFLLTLFDYHTTRRLVPLFHLAFAMVPAGFFALALRLPDDAALLRRRPWIVRALDGLGLVLGTAMIWADGTGVETASLRLVCSALFGASFFFFAAAFLFRFARARGDRRATMRALLYAMVPAHVAIGAAFALATLHLGGATIALCAVPALALTPLSSVIAFIRHDLWGSRALLSRVLTRLGILAVAFVASSALGAAFAALCDAPLGHALLASAAGALVACALVGPALRVGDVTLFPSRAVYKPTIEQLSEELTSITVPEDVALAVERTVLRWLPCERVEFVPRPRGPAAPPEDAPRSHARQRASSGVHAIQRRRPGPAAALDERAAPSEAAPSAEEGALSIDVLFRGDPIAVLRVGRKRGGALFTSEDVDLLRTIANQAALALTNAYGYAELELRRRQQAVAFRTEREALIETVAAEIAHEIRYPINFFRSIFQQRRPAAGRLDEEEISIGCEEVERLERLVSGLRRMSARRLTRRPVPLAELAVKAERLLRDQLGGRSLALDVAGAPAVTCDPDQVTQILANLVANALDAAGDQGEVGVRWAWAEEARAGDPDRDAGAPRATGPRAGALIVWDTGKGFAGDAARLFAPWYTTKPRGTGLGLAITHRLVRAHGWTIDPERRDGRTSFVISIPGAHVIEPSGAHAIDPGASHEPSGDHAIDPGGSHEPSGDHAIDPGGAAAGEVA